MLKTPYKLSGNRKVDRVHFIGIGGGGDERSGPDYPGAWL